MSDHLCETPQPETCYRCALNVDEVRHQHEEQVAEYKALGCPPCCPRCSSYTDADGELDTLADCATSPLKHWEICEPKRWADDVCADCEKAMGWTA